MSQKVTEDLEQQVIQSYTELKSGRAVAKALGIGETTVRRILQRNPESPKQKKPMFGGGIYTRETVKATLPARGKIKRYLFTCAQNNTLVHRQFWENLLAFADFYEAEIHVAKIEYNKGGWSQHAPKPGSGHASDFEEVAYDPEITEYVSDNRMEVARGLVWCGEVQILPTAVNPLSSFENYTGRSSGIFPASKFAMMSIPSMADEFTKFNYTTGTVTLRNYIQKKAGLKAEHHHTYGALMVEVNDKGNWWCRQINAVSADGSFQDLDVCVNDGKVEKVKKGDAVLEAINWGDIHAAVVDPMVRKLAWAAGGIVDRYRPRHQFMHDLFDMAARGHHDMKNPHLMFSKYVNGTDSVEAEIKLTADLMNEAARSFCKMVVVDSNHDGHFTRWLREEDYRQDHPNAVFFLKAQLAKYDSIARKDKNFQLLEWALRNAGCPKDALFLKQDNSFIICPEAGGGIECGLHGHDGPNGSRGNPNSFRKMGRKMNVGHVHSAGIYDIVYVSGTSSLLRLNYTKGPGSWSHSLIFTYPNGKRCIVTIFDGKERA